MNNEPETITLYDKPAIDPGEGWRIYDQDKEGLEPRPDAEYYCGGKWFKRACPEDRMTLKDVYRVPITQQPDRLTELRQQGERQAARIVELEESEKELREKFKKADDLAHVVLSTYDGFNDHITQRDEQIAGLRARVKELVAENSRLRDSSMSQAAQIESLQTQVRSAEEALRVEKQKHDEAVKQLEAELQATVESGREIITAKSQTDFSVHAKAAAFDFLTEKLDELRPGWRQDDGSLIEAVKKLLEATSHPLRWERRKPTEEECRERFVLEWNGKTKSLFASTPGSSRPDDDWRDQICILPPIAEPEPERRMITQRRWLCHNGSHSWVEVWPDDGDEPTDQWVERVRTDMTRVVME